MDFTLTSNRISLSVSIGGSTLVLHAWVDCFGQRKLACDIGERGVGVSQSNDVKLRMCGICPLGAVGGGGGGACDDGLLLVNRTTGSTTAVWATFGIVGDFVLNTEFCELGGAGVAFTGVSQGDIDVVVLFTKLVQSAVFWSCGLVDVNVSVVLVFSDTQKPFSTNNSTIF